MFFASARQISEALRLHEQAIARDPRFGPALGPKAAMRAVRAFERVGYATLRGDSDWQFGSEDQAIQRAVLGGWALVAQELGGLPSAAIAGWLQRRGALIDQGRASMRVGHVDLFATPRALR